MSLRPRPEGLYTLHLHGTPRLRGPQGRETALERRAAALCALAALAPGITREQAARWLWPDSRDPRRNLRQQLLRFRHQFGCAVVTGEDTLHLAADVCRADPDEAAGPLLQGHDWDDCEDFAAWLEAQRRLHLQQRLQRLQAEQQQAEAARDFDSARQLAQRLLAADPGSEARHRELMRLHYLGGDVAAGLDVYAQLQQRLTRQLAAQPSAATEQLAQTLRAAGTQLSPPVQGVPASLQRPPRLVGRQREWQQVHDAWGAQRAALLLGEAGMGKSRLMGELAATPGAVLVSARPGDQAVPFATLARALRQAHALQGPLPAGAQRDELSRVLPEWAPSVPLPAPGSKLLLQQAVEQLLERAAPRLLALDDLHFADEASLDMLLALVGAERLRGPRWLLAQRPAEHTAASTRLRDGLLESQQLDLVPLAALDEQGMAELVDCLGIPELDGHSLAPQLVRHTGGNPMFALETLKAHLQALRRTGTAAPAGLPQPASIGVLIERRLRQLSTDALALARLAAVAGVDFDIELAQAVLGEGALALADRWDELERAQVLRGNAFAHDLVFETALRTLPRPVAASLHGLVARALEQRGAEPARIAAHWQAAGRGLQAVPHLVAAAERASARFESRQAALHCEQAADLLEQAGDEAGAFDLHYRAARGWGKLCEVQQLQRLATLLAPRASDDARRARAAWVRAYVHELQGRYDEMHDEGTALLEHATRAGDTELQGEGLAYIACAHFWRGRTAEALPMMQRASAHYHALGLLEQATTWAHGAAVCEHSLGRLDAARAGLQACLPEFERQGNRNMQATTLSTLCTIAMDEGRITDALALVTPARALLLDLEAAPDTWTPVVTCHSRALRLLGRHGEALEVLEDGARRHTTGEAAVHRARLDIERATLWLELGRPDRVLQLLPGLDAAGHGSPSVQRMVATLRCLVQAAGTPAAAPTVALDPGDQDRRGQMPLRRAQAQLLPAAKRAELLAQVVADAQALGLRAHALAARVERLDALREAGQAQAAAQEALAVTPELHDTVPWMYPPQAGLALFRALIEPQPYLALGALFEAVRWVQASAERLSPGQVAAFRERNPVNRALLAAAARHAQPAGRP